MRSTRASWGSTTPRPTRASGTATSGPCATARSRRWWRTSSAPTSSAPATASDRPSRQPRAPNRGRSVLSATAGALPTSASTKVCAFRVQWHPPCSLGLSSERGENKIMIRYRCSLAVLGWMVSSALVWAQKGPTAAPVVGDAIDVRVVNVEVVVTGRRGNRVTGLKPGDFRLKVDGKAIPVEYFTEVRDGRAAVPAADAGAPVPGIEAGETIGTQYLVFIDDFFSIGAPRDVVLASLKKELGRLGSADRMSIVDWDGSRLVRLADWSASRQELAAALDRAQARPARGLEQRVALNFLREEQRTHLYGARVS